MPKRVRAPVSYKVRTSKKYKPTYSKNPSSKHILKQSQRGSLWYTTEFSLNPGVAGVPASHVFAANGVYDPDVTVAGHQPRGFDQVMALYDHATVIGFKAHVWATNTDSNNGQMFTMYLNDDGVAAASQFELMEAPNCKPYALAPKGSGGDTLHMVYSCNPNRFLGRPSPMSEDNLRNSKSSNPNEIAFLIMSCFPINGSSDSGGVDVYVRLEYECIFTEPDIPSIS